MAKTMIRVPDVGSSDPVDVIEISVNVGDTIAAEDTIIVLESDKATVEVPAPEAGTVAELLVKVGDRVKQGDPLLALAEGAEQEPPASEPSDKPEDDSPSAKQQEKAVEPAPTDELDPAPSGPEQTVAVPDLGDIDSAEVIEVSVQEGDNVDAEQTLVVLESDKASMEIPSPAAGTVTRLQVKVGDRVGNGDPLLILQGSSAADKSEPAAASAPSAEVEEPDSAAADATEGTPRQTEQGDQGNTSGSATAVAAAPSTPVHAGPAVRKLARQTGAELGQIQGTGPKGRIVKEDVYEHLKRRMQQSGAANGAVATLPEIDFSQFGEIERVPLNKLRRLSASNLHRAWLTIPHVTQHDQADITELEAFRQQHNRNLAKGESKLTMLAFLVLACARALRDFPDFNSSLQNDGETLIHKHYIHIGVAVDTPNGLVVPVIRDADKKGLSEIAAEVATLADKARNRKLTPVEMKGGTFSISSLGGIGGSAFTPIVNWPEVAILGVSRSRMTPHWDGSQFVPRLTLPLSLSYDHRVIDGAAAARFTAHLSYLLDDLRRVLV